VVTGGQLNCKERGGKLDPTREFFDTATFTCERLGCNVSESRTPFDFLHEILNDRQGGAYARTGGGGVAGRGGGGGVGPQRVEVGVGLVAHLLKHRDEEPSWGRRALRWSGTAAWRIKNLKRKGCNFCKEASRTAANF